MGITGIAVRVQFGLGRGHGGAMDIRTRLLITAHDQQSARLGLLQQIAESAETEGTFTEIRPTTLDGFLQHRSPDLAAVTTLGHQGIEGLDRNLDTLATAALQLFLAPLVLLGRTLRRRLRIARVALGRTLTVTHQVVVKDEFIAVGDEQIRSGLLHAHADHLFRVLAQLGHQRREVGVTADDDEGIDMRLGVAQVERIDDETDVGRILARLAQVRNLDQLEVGLVHRGLEALVTVPVAIGLLDDDVALEQQALKDAADVEFVVVGITHAKRHVLEVAIKRHVDAVGGRRHVFSP